MEPPQPNQPPSVLPPAPPTAARSGWATAGRILGYLAAVSLSATAWATFLIGTSLANCTWGLFGDPVQPEPSASTDFSSADLSFALAAWAVAFAPWLLIAVASRARTTRSVVAIVAGLVTIVFVATVLPQALDPAPYWERTCGS